MVTNFKKKKRLNSRSSKKWMKKIVKVRRITKVVKGGKKLRFGALVIIGNKRGVVGVGVGKANDVRTAIDKAEKNGKRNLIKIPLTQSATIPHNVSGQYGACNVIIKPISIGSGVIAGGSVRILLEMAGVRNILSKQLGSDNLLNNARATIRALKSIKIVTESLEVKL
ncbi:MAG: 30S ribosomal protein S5 [Cyanobacteria bacterium J06628_3]